MKFFLIFIVILLFFNLVCVLKIKSIIILKILVKTPLVNRNYDFFNMGNDDENFYAFLEYYTTRGEGTQAPISNSTEISYSQYHNDSAQIFTNSTPSYLNDTIFLKPLDTNAPKLFKHQNIEIKEGNKKQSVQ